MKVQVELGKSVFQRAGVTLQGAKKTSDNGLERTVSEEPKVGRNEPCPCGSGKKYKKCHGV